MGFEPPVPQQDTNWEIRVAVQASLAVQVLLIFVTPLRRTSPSRLTRFVVWSGYLLADWVANLALGLLLNALGNIGPSSTATVTISHVSPKPSASGGGSSSSSGSSSSPVIFAFWAPFLLLHLGGPDTITAFSVEDNELWRRHLIGLLFELFAAATVFFCSLRQNPFILASAFMFVVGSIKYAERTYSLYRGSADGLRKSMLGDPDPGPNYAKMMEEYDAKIKAGLPAEIDVKEAPVSAEPKIGQKLNKDNPIESNAFQLYQTFQYLFADLILSFNEREVSRKFFSQLDAAKAFQVIEVELGFVYDIVYTKAAVVHSRLGYALRPIGSACIAAAFLAFFFADKRGFTRLDVAITYALLVGAAVLDFAALVMLLCSDWARVSFAEKRLFKEMCARFKNWRFGRRRRRRRWSERISRMSLIGYCLDEPAGAGVPKWVGSRAVSRLADKVWVKEFLDETLYVSREKVEVEMKEFIFDKLNGAASETSEADGYEKIKEVCERRGAAALKKLELSDNPELKEKGKELMKTVEADFDESLLLWHIATELCHNRDKSTPTQRQSDVTEKQRTISVMLSEYLLYLLVNQPAMLSTAAGIGLLRFRDTCAEARRFFAMGGRQLTPEEERERLLQVNTSVRPAVVKGDRSKSVLFDACILAKKLLAMGERKWGVMSAVWMEMLAYTACHCQAREHARQLSCGGELATVVWLLMAHVGLGKLYQIQAGDARAKLIVDK
ncbi:uncharacterized protein LOC109705281 [Ananas comosus]|uniref:Uncharacterized protein LOC109705281 n=1 Tax=Ananas comosus TaxID=4615 RepID=A0A6P5EJM1_ANACO|nr:uncharacterized protein LOC109705281 [Ananas comosus]